jgi:hypothetical protein
MRVLLFFLSSLVLACSSGPVSTDSVNTEIAGDPATSADADASPQETWAQEVCTPGSHTCEDNAVWGCNEQGTERVFMGYCDTGSSCEGGVCVCVPTCDGKACGDDGCGGSCGDCGAQGTCMPSGACCDRACGERQCGPDACGGSCGTCEVDRVCVEVEGMCCLPNCDGKTCGTDGCGGECGTCDAGVDCPLNGVCGCDPQCDDVVCDRDGCGGLCGGCFSFAQDDGTTETAYGYDVAPESDPIAVVCMVRVSLPHTHMQLTSFTAGWMYGLWELQIPFELVVAKAEDMNCQLADESVWWTEACLAPEAVLTTLTSLVPAPPYEPQPAEELGEHVMPASEIFIGARFLVAEYPIYVCPVDDAGSGGNSFMFPVSMEDDVATLNASSMTTKTSDAGAIAFRADFALTADSVPAESAQ